MWLQTQELSPQTQGRSRWWRRIVAISVRPKLLHLRMTWGTTIKPAGA